MKIRLLAVGTRMPAWVDAGFREYQKRMPHQCALELVEIRTAPRSGSGTAPKATRTEANALLAALSDRDHVVALDQRGRQYSTESLAGLLQQWMHAGRNVALLIGGPDGFTQDVRDRAHEIWSLSELTLPHGLVRVVVAEQIYRAWSLLQGAPYHRGNE